MMNWKKIILTALLVLPLIMAGGFGEDLQAKDKNPCAKNPCAAKNPCGMKTPGAIKNPCAIKEKAKPIRKSAITDNDKLMEAGAKLWNDAKLGKSGLSCSTCHPGGELLKKEPFPKYIDMAGDILTLDQMINFCMMNPMEGKPLNWNSHEITALAAYSQSLVREGGEAMHPCGTKHPCGMKNPCGKK